MRKHDFISHPINKENIGTNWNSFSSLEIDMEEEFPIKEAMIHPPPKDFPTPQLDQQRPSGF